jgi:hypothetical protein
MQEKLYEVVVRKCLWTDEEHLVQDVSKVEPKPQVAIFTRTVKLPFIPFIGLKICDGIWDSGPLRSVVWDVKEEKFSCSTDDEFPRYSFGSHLSYDDLLSLNIEMGWQRPERGGGNAPR